jgi:O-methyltransferase involved in polyketide biosynthesis
MMEEKIKLNLGDVQKTLFLPLWGRAVESRKKHPWLVDEAALKIIDEVDFDFSKAAENMDDLTMIAWIKRSLICDKVVSQFTMKYPDATIVNIGCGLDTTFDRVDNGHLQWYDLDLPDVIELRRKFIPESERRHYIASSFLDEGWLDDLPVRSKLLFMAAGVFYYFEGDQIKSFFLHLLDNHPGSEILFDVSSPIGVRIANQKVVDSAGLDEASHLKWGLENKRDLVAWDSRIRIIKTYHYFRTLRLSLRNLVMGTFSDLLGIQYMLHLKLGEK